MLRDRMRALTFDVICHAVFGVTEPERVERLRAALSAVIDTPTLVMAVSALRADLGPWSPGGKLKRRYDGLVAFVVLLEHGAYSLSQSIGGFCGRRKTP